MRTKKRIERPSHPQFWSAETSGPVTVLRLHVGSEPLGVDLQRVSTLWEFFEGLPDRQGRVLLITGASEDLSPDALDHLWEYLREIPPDEFDFRCCDSRARVELTRADCAMQRFINYVRDSRLFVATAFQGEVDINFLGLVLACDYRIASEDTVIVNRDNKLGMEVGTAVPWFLIRLLGQRSALDVLLNRKRLTAYDALNLGIVDALTSTRSYEEDSLAIAQALAAKGVGRLLAMKRVIAASERPLSEYLRSGGAGFTTPPKTPFCEHCGYNLTGNVSGICPECGTPVPCEDRFAIGAANTQ